MSEKPKKPTRAGRQRRHDPDRAPVIRRLFDLAAQGIADSSGAQIQRHPHTSTGIRVRWRWDPVSTDSAY